MSTGSTSPAAIVRHELHALRDQWWCFLLLGFSLVVLGSICIVEPLIASLASVMFLGFLLMAGGHHANRQLVLGWQMERHVVAHVDRCALFNRRVHDN